MTYKIDEHTEFWGGKHAAQTVKQSVADYPPDDGYPTPKQVKAMADVSTSTVELRKQLAAWPISHNEAVKHDSGKPDWSLVPFESLEGMVKVLEFGAQKYAGWNWILLFIYSIFNCFCTRQYSNQYLDAYIGCYYKCI